MHIRLRWCTITISGRESMARWRAVSGLAGVEKRSPVEAALRGFLACRYRRARGWSAARCFARSASLRRLFQVAQRACALSRAVAGFRDDRVLSGHDPDRLHLGTHLVNPGGNVFRREFVQTVYLKLVVLSATSVRQLPNLRGRWRKSTFGSCKMKWKVRCGRREAMLLRIEPRPWKPMSSAMERARSMVSGRTAPAPLIR